MEAPKQYLNVEAEAPNQLEGPITGPGQPVRRRWALTCAVTALVLMAVAFGSFGGAADLKASFNKASTALGKAFVGGRALNRPAIQSLRPGIGHRHALAEKKRNGRPPTLARPMSRGSGLRMKDDGFYQEPQQQEKMNDEPHVDNTSIGDLSPYTINSLEAVDSLNRDIPQALRRESDPQRVAPTNWDVYTDDLVTEVKAGDPMALRLLEALVPSWKVQVKGKRSNQRVLEELRTCFRTIRLSKLVENEKITATTHKYVDPSTREEVIETRWTTTLPMKRLQPPKLFPRSDSTLVMKRPSRLEWLPRPPRPDKRIVVIEALSNFYLNAEGKIYRQSIDELNLLVDGKPLDSQILSKFLDVVALLPLPRLPLPPDNFRK